MEPRVIYSKVVSHIVPTRLPDLQQFQKFNKNLQKVILPKMQKRHNQCSHRKNKEKN